MNKIRFTWSWSGFVVSILALGLVSAWSLSVIFVSLHGGEYNLPEYVVQSQLALGQTLAGGLIGWLGARVAQRSKPVEELPTSVENTYETDAQGTSKEKHVEKFGNVASDDP